MLWMTLELLKLKAINGWSDTSVSARSESPQDSHLT
jgi:hypothetical protein